MSISRRSMLVGSAVLGMAAAGPGIAGEPRQESSRELSGLIETHEAAYAAFIVAIRKPNGISNNHAAIGREEEKALIDVCGFPAATEADRRSKAAYLLRVEARGELDLREHMQAVLLSMV